MTSMKTILLGSAAAIVATGAAQAADIPMKAKKAPAVQYVEVCPAFGKGFYRLPGSDICMKNFGYLKVDFAYSPAVDAFDAQKGNYIAKANNDEMGWQFQTRPGWDFRAPTEFGTLRTVIQLRFDERYGVMNRAGPQNSSSASDTENSHSHYEAYPYIEWAGFLIGKAGSQFDYFSDHDVLNAVGGSEKETQHMQFTYIWSLPGGTKATIGLEDRDSHDAGVLNGKRNPAFGGTISLSHASTQGPARAFDVVGTLSTKQGWGSAKISAAAHNLSIISGPTGSTISCLIPGAPGVTNAKGSCPTKSAWGYAVLGGITFKLPQWGPKDQILFEASHGDGAIVYAGVVSKTDYRPYAFARHGEWSGGLLRQDYDANIYDNGSGGLTIDKEKATSLIGQLRHYWTPMLRSNLTAAEVWLRPGSLTKQTTLTNGGRGNAHVFDIAGNLIWGEKAKTAEIGVEVLYKKVNQDLPAGQTAAVDLPAGIAQNPSQWGVDVQIRRDY
jgi:opacity protein-like surface antigen